MKHLATVALALGLSASSAAAEVPPAARRDIIDKTQKALVRVDRLSSDGVAQGHGSGVVISEEPPIVATCYHVVMAADQLRIRASNALGGQTFPVKGVATDGEHDVAFLLLDVARWPRHVPWRRLPNTNELVASDFVGFGFGGYNDWRISHFQTGGTPLEKLSNLSAGPTRLDILNRELQVLSFNVSSTFMAGDSGLPIFDGGGALVGLGAGSVVIGGSTKFDFAIPIERTAPTRASEFKGPPFLDSRFALGPYGSGALLTKLALNVRGAPPIDPSVAKSDEMGQCLSYLYQLVSAFAGRRKELPAALGDDRPQTCRELYVKLRQPLLEQEQDYLGATTLALVAESASAVEQLGLDALAGVRRATEKSDVANLEVGAAMPELFSKLRHRSSSLAPVKIEPPRDVGSEKKVSQLDDQEQKRMATALLLDKRFLTDARLKSHWAPVAAFGSHLDAPPPPKLPSELPETQQVKELRNASSELVRSVTKAQPLADAGRTVATSPLTDVERASVRLRRAAELREDASDKLTLLIENIIVAAAR